MPEPTDAGVAEPAGALPAFILTVPANWCRLDLDPRTRAETIARLVEERIGAGPGQEMRAARRELTAVLRRYARQAASRGAVYAALMDQEVEGLSLSASLLVAVGEAPRDAAGRPVLDPAELGRIMSGLDDSRPAATDRPPADLFETRVGTAARLRRTTDSGFADTDGRAVVTAETQYFVPVPGTDKVLALTFSTPSLPARQALEELFDAIAGTLDWVWEAGQAPP
jgi:hypothetical protein